MPTYISLLNWTEQGIRSVRDTTKRAMTFQTMAKKMQVSIKDIYWTMGHYDVVVIMEAPDDQAISRLMLGLGALGNVKSASLRAYSAQEMNQLLRGMP
jgi:uncharacterized protein with GYD domain